MDSSELALRFASAAHDERFSDLIRTHSRFVFRVAYSVTRNAQDAEDVAQETFWKLYRNNSWQNLVEDRAFLARVAWRLAASAVAKRRPQDGMPTLASLDASPEQTVMQLASDALVHRLIYALPDDLRQVIALSTVDELSSPEIAAILDIPEGTVRTRLMRAREVLKRKLTAYDR